MNRRVNEGLNRHQMWDFSFLFDCVAGGSEGASLGDLFRACEQGGVCPLGRGSEAKGQSEFRQSFLRRAADPQLNERLHRLRILTSTLKVGPTVSYSHIYTYRDTCGRNVRTHEHICTQKHSRAKYHTRLLAHQVRNFCSAKTFSKELYWATLFIEKIKFSSRIWFILQV